jgi:hypothetical protein
MDVPDHRSRFIALRRTSKQHGSCMVMPSLKTGHGASRRRFWLAMSGFVMAFALLPFSYKVERRLETAVRIKGAESRKVDLELAERFQSPYTHPLVLVISGIPDPDSAESADALAFLTSSLRSVPGVSGCRLESGLARPSVHWEKWRGLDHRRGRPAR